MQLREYHYKTGADSQEFFQAGTEEYKRITRSSAQYLLNFIRFYGYEDVFLICALHGHVMFTASGGSDSGTNLKHGPYKHEGLARLWQRVVKTGKIAIELRGHILSGGFSLVKMKGKGEKNWLLIKNKDEFSDVNWTILGSQKI